MGKVNTRAVGKAFGEAREAQGHGSIRVEVRNGLTIGYSYSEPVCIHDGRDTLRAVRSWSVTTSGHVSTLHGPGRTIPASTEQLRRVARGGLREFGEAVAMGLRALDAATERNAAKGVPMERIEASFYQPTYSFRTETCRLAKDGNRWHLYVNDREVGDFRTMRDARVAAWDALGLRPSAAFWDVTEADFPSEPTRMSSRVTAYIVR